MTETDLRGLALTVLHAQCLLGLISPFLLVTRSELQKHLWRSKRKWNCFSNPRTESNIKQADLTSFVLVNFQVVSICGTWEEYPGEAVWIRWGYGHSCGELLLLY